METRQMNKNNSWLGRQFVDRTFDDEIEVDVYELRRLLDEGDALADWPGRLGG